MLCLHVTVNLTKTTTASHVTLTNYKYVSDFRTIVKVTIQGVVNTQFPFIKLVTQCVSNMIQAFVLNKTGRGPHPVWTTKLITQKWKVCLFHYSAGSHGLRGTKRKKTPTVPLTSKSLVRYKSLEYRQACYMSFFCKTWCDWSGNLKTRFYTYTKSHAHVHRHTKLHYGFLWHCNPRKTVCWQRVP